MTGPDWPTRSIFDLVDIAVPIIQAPMAGSGGAALAIGAMQGGALGSLPCALLTPEQVVDQVGQVRATASGPINLNFFCHTMPKDFDQAAWLALLQPYYREYDSGPPHEPPPLRAPFSEAMCEVVEQLRPEIVSFHFGLPSPRLINRIRASSAKILSSATSVAEARWLADHGCDAIIAQGWEAGGHAGRFLPGDPLAHMGLMALLPQIVDAVSVPVIAAGGIGDARGIAAAFMLGASAVQLGTAYLHCPESLASQLYRQSLRSAAAERTVFTNLFSGGLARGIPNRLIDELGARNPAAPPFPHATAALANLRRIAEARGNIDFTPLWAGQVARLGDELPAKKLTEKLAADALAMLSAAPPRFGVDR